MKKFTVIFVLAFLAMIGLNKYERIAWAEIEVDIDFFKFISSDGELYEFEFEAEGVKDVKTIMIKTPTGKKMELKNSLGFGEIGLWASYGSYDEFKKKFPEGEYSITLSPKKYGSLSVDITHDFPETPEITYPEDGATNVSLAPTITWEELSNIHYLTIYINAVVGDEGDNEIECEIELFVDATSYTIPSGLLQPNTEYELSLESETTDGRENEPSTNLSTIRVIRFTTGSE